MTTYVFEEVKLFASKTGICSVCGKKAARSMKFSQTINPFNKMPDGTKKTRHDILAELRIQVAEWRKEPPTHAKCYF
jgi:hypothetical protein